MTPFMLKLSIPPHWKKKIPQISTKRKQTNELPSSFYNVIMMVYESQEEHQYEVDSLFDQYLYLEGVYEHTF